MSNEAESTKPPVKLPPGMILGPDGKPCRTCNSLSDFTKAGKKIKSPSSSASSTAAATASTVSLASTALSDGGEGKPQVQCPPDVEQLGRSTWTFLHTTAAYYPENPSATQRSDMLSLLKALPGLYPCGHCASHLKDNLKQFPPEAYVSGRGPLSRWLCARHNDVNERLGKPAFDCSKTDERWKDGPADGSCDVSASR